MNTKTKIFNYVKEKLSTDEKWAVKGMVRIYRENQTNDEQVQLRTTHLNGIGFSGCDAELLSSFARQFELRGTLTAKQMVYVFKKMKKYTKQVISMISPEKMKELEDKVLTLYK